MEELITLRIPTELREKLDAEAESQRRSRAFIVREAVEKFFANDGKPKPTKKPVKKAGAR